VRFPIFAGHTVAAAAILIAAMLAPASAAKTPVAAGTASVEHKIYGFVQSISGNTLVIKNRAGKTIVVDGHLAHSNLLLYPGRPVIVFGTTDAAGTLHASAVWRTYPDWAHWPADS
jgi:hypothetical protein